MNDGAMKQWRQSGKASRVVLKRKIISRVRTLWKFYIELNSEEVNNRDEVR